MITDTKLFTPLEASKLLRISTVTLWRLRRAGKISFRRIASKVAFTQQDLDDFLERQRFDAIADNKS